jgi:hypothetical protein
VGFSPKWRDWLSITLAPSSSRVLLNGAPGKPIKHERGMQQGDPLSPIAMDLLQRLLNVATEKGVLHPISARAKGIKTSLYADDASIFISPMRQDLAVLRVILDIFGQASGLRTNLLKSEVFLISCNNINLAEVLEGFPALVNAFPCHYLGLSLHPKKIRKVDFMPLLDKVGAKLPSWKGKLMIKAARAQLVKSVLTSAMTYHAIVFKLSKWLLKKINQLRRNSSGKERMEKVTKVEHVSSSGI